MSLGTRATCISRLTIGSPCDHSLQVFPFKNSFTNLGGDGSGPKGAAELAKDALKAYEQMRGNFAKVHNGIP